MLHTMTSGSPFRDGWTTPYNIQAPFFHPNYTFPIFHNPLSYPFFPPGGAFHGPAIFNRPYLDPTENRPLVPFDTNTSGHVYLPHPYPYSMQVPSISSPFMERGFTTAELSSRRLLGNQSLNFNSDAESNQASASFGTDAPPRSTYGNESADGTSTENRKRRRDYAVEDSWSTASVSIPTREDECGSGAIDLSINSGIKRQRLNTYFGTCDSVPSTLKENVGDSKRHVYTQKTDESSFLGLNTPGTSTVGSVTQERELVPVKNESSQALFVPPTTLHGTDIFNQNGLPECSRMWTSSGAEANANRPFLPDILNIPFNPFFPPLLPGTNWWMERPFDTYPSGTANSASSFDFSNPLGIKREELVPTSAAATGLEVAVPERGTEDLIPSPQSACTSIETPEIEPKPGALVPVGSSETEKLNTQTTIKLEDIIITRPAEVSKLQDSPRSQIMRNWLLENLERGLKQEAVFRIRKRRHVNIRGLKLLSRGIERIERHSGKGRLTGLGLLCALAEERMRDDIGVSDEDSWENNSEGTEISETEEMTIEVDVEQSDDGEGGKPVKIRHRREEFYYAVAREEDVYVEVKNSEDSDSDPPLLIKADDLPVWSTEDDRNRPPTLSPNTEEQGCKDRSDVADSVSLVRPIKDDADQEVERLMENAEYDETKNSEVLNIKKEREAGCEEMPECSLSAKKLSPPRSSDKVKEGEKAKKWRAKSTDCSSHNFRQLDPNIPRIKEEEEEEEQEEEEEEDEEEDEDEQDQVSSFEIVRTDGDSSETSSSQLWKKEEFEAGCSGESGSESSTKDNKRHGKLILRLRRERLNKSEDEGSRPKSCVLSTERLMISKFPVKILTVDTGLFYTGQLSAIRPPDVYGITIDGERGNRPHIYSREEVLNNSFLEMKPTSKKDLSPGTRVCAYWSEQCRCLYPGSVAASAIIDPDPNSVNIEFDDGDSCRISINNIRLLPDNYPITEYNPNPLTIPGKKKRRLNVKENQNRESVPETTDEAVMTEQSPKRDPVAEASGSKIEETESDLSRRRKKSHNRSSVDRGRHKKKHKHRHHRKKHGEGGPSERKRRKVKKGAAGAKSQRSGAVISRKPWGWSGKGFRRPGIKGKARKEYYRAIQRGNERIVIGECAVFLSSGRPDRPFIGRIESMWETWGANMVVRVKWFYHPEETVGCPATLEYPGALFESPHSDENDVQTISHKCEVLPLKRYIEKLGKDAKKHDGSTKLYYLAGFYDPTNTSLQFQEGVK